MRRLKGAKRAFLGTAIAGAALLSIATEPAKAGPIDVFVGYADNLRASGFFPNPWIDDPGIVTQSQTGQTFDSGAVRIDNNTAAAITISNFKVVLNGGSGPTFNFWNSLTIPAGQKGIFAQTDFTENFDTSDFGVFGAFPPAALNPTSLSECNSP